MAEHGLHAVTALGGAAPRMAEIGPISITERFDVALGSVATRRGRAADVVRGASDAGLPLPPPGKAEFGGQWSAFWVAPEMWFVEAPFASHEDIAAHLRTIFGDAASVTEQTDAWVRFDLSAPDLHPLFARLCNVDLPVAPVGFATRTVIDHLGCYLIKRAADQVTLYGPRSSAQSLWHAIDVAARSVI